MSKETVVDPTEATFSVKPGDPFYINAPTTDNDCVMGHKRDTARIRAKNAFMATISDRNKIVKLVEGMMPEDEMREFLTGFAVTLEVAKESDLGQVRELLASHYFRVRGNSRIIGFIKKHKDINNESRIMDTIIESIRDK